MVYKPNSHKAKAQKTSTIKMRIKKLPKKPSITQEPKKATIFRFILQLIIKKLVSLMLTDIWNKIQCDTIIDNIIS